jgi:hypothetical protein
MKTAILILTALLLAAPAAHANDIAMELQQIEWQLNQMRMAQERATAEQHRRQPLSPMESMTLWSAWGNAQSQRSNTMIQALEMQRQAIQQRAMIEALRLSSQPQQPRRPYVTPSVDEWLADFE